jgi:hypothetical protein
MESSDLQIDEVAVSSGKSNAGQPALLWRVIAWIFPVFYLLCMIFIWCVFALPLRTFELVAGVPVDYQGLASIATIVFFPISVLVMFFKSTWFRKRFLLMLVIWTLLAYPMLGTINKIMHGAFSKNLSFWGQKIEQ